ncbi:MAG: FliO/MopB family protein, partial [Candidatus Zixiibacteriota bacterium]
KILKYKRRSYLIVAIILAIALAGVFIINTDQAAADQEKNYINQNKTAVQNNSEEKVISGFMSSNVPSLLKLGSALVVVIISIYLGIFLLRKLMGKKYSGNRQNNLLEVLETTYIAPKKTVSLLRVADKSVLIGITDNHISVLTELNSDETNEILASVSLEKDTDNFKTFLKTASKKLKTLSIKKNRDTILET